MQPLLDPPLMTREQQNTAIASPGALRAFLTASDREYLVLRATDLVDSLLWPGGVEVLMQTVACYRDHRRCIDTGLVDPDPALRMADGSSGGRVFKDEFLEPDEIDAAIEQLQRTKAALVAERAAKGIR